MSRKFPHPFYLIENTQYLVPGEIRQLFLDYSPSVSAGAWHSQERFLDLERGMSRPEGSLESRCGQLSFNRVAMIQYTLLAKLVLAVSITIKTFRRAFMRSSGRHSKKP